MRQIQNILRLVIILFLQNSMAQENNFGVKAGPNIANAMGTSSSSRTSFHAGFLFDAGISEKFSLQTEFLYSGQGYKKRLGGIDFVYKFDYINIPILGSLYVNDALAIQLGPQIGYTISGNVAAGNDVEEVTGINRFDPAGVVGIQWNLNRSIFLQGRYALGLGRFVENVKARNSVISFSLGFLLKNSSSGNDDL